MLAIKVCIATKPSSSPLYEPAFGDVSWNDPRRIRFDLVPVLMVKAWLHSALTHELGVGWVGWMRFLLTWCWLACMLGLPTSDACFAVILEDAIFVYFLRYFACGGRFYIQF